MEHIEQAGVHSATRPARCRRTTPARRHRGEPPAPDRRHGTGAGVVGLMNVQFAIQEKPRADGRAGRDLRAGGQPRASRTVPFVSNRHTGVQLAKVAARCMVGQTPDSQGWRRGHAAVLQRGEAVVSSPAWTPSRARDEVHRRSDGRRQDLWRGLRQKPNLAARRPTARRSGKVFLTVKNSDKPQAVQIARAARPWASPWSPPGTAQAIQRRRHRRRDRRQRSGRPPAHRRHDQERRHLAGDQHRRRAAQRHHRQPGAIPHQLTGCACADHHHHLRRRSRRRGGGSSWTGWGDFGEMHAQLP